MAKFYQYKLSEVFTNIFIIKNVCKDVFIFSHQGRRGEPNPFQSSQWQSMTPKKILLFTKQIQTGVMLFCCTNVCCVYLFLHDLIKRRKKFVSYPREFQCWWPSFKRCLILCRLLNVKTYFFIKINIYLT